MVVVEAACLGEERMSLEEEACGSAEEGEEEEP